MLKLLHGCVHYRNTLQTCIYKNHVILKLNYYTYVCPFSLPFCTFLVIVCMLLCSNHLKSNVNIFIHNVLHLSEISLRGKKNVLTDTLVLESIDSYGHFVPSFSFNHSTKNICLFLFLHNKFNQSETEEYPFTHIIFLYQYTFSKGIYL